MSKCHLILLFCFQVDEDTNITEFCLQYSYGNIKSNDDKNTLIFYFCFQVDEDTDITEFCLQYSYGNIKSNDDNNTLILYFCFQVDEDTDITEFCLQYSYGNVKSNDDRNASFHTVYEGPETAFLVRQLRTTTVYSFRVAGRVDSHTPWDIFSIPVAASTSIYHHRELCQLL